ncbi:MAG: hypothetical protein JJO71_30765 [Escherichia coli]|nr:hypothetical protein [Escherichia coli]
MVQQQSFLVAQRLLVNITVKLETTVARTNMLESIKAAVAAAKWPAK